MGGIKLQLLCGVRIELAVWSLPYLALAQYPSRFLPLATFCVKKGCYKHANPLGLRLNPTRGLPITGSRIWGPFKQTNKLFCWNSNEGWHAIFRKVCKIISEKGFWRRIQSRVTDVFLGIWHHHERCSIYTFLWLSFHIVQSLEWKRKKMSSLHFPTKYVIFKHLM